MSSLSVTLTLSSGVVALLILLAVFLVGMVIYRKVTDNADTAADAEESREVSAPLAASPSAASAPAGNDDSLIAAITAALAATLAEENGGQAPAFRVVAFRKAPTVSQSK
ncbi:MAG: OadG family protein [Clostridia bacterium]|nr:OadG family protein [Clostridia bacterium]